MVICVNSQKSMFKFKQIYFIIICLFLIYYLILINRFKINQSKKQNLKITLEDFVL